MIDFLVSTFRDPLFLLVLLVVPFVYRLAARLPAAVTYSDLGHLERAPRSWRTRFAKLPAWGLAAAAAALVIAMAGPRTGEATTLQRREGIAIAMVVDHSGSMGALDFVRGDRSVTRLDIVKGVFRDFVVGGENTPGRPDDLIGLVAFGTYADGLCPLTLDHANLATILDDLDLAQQDESGTALGEGLALAIERLEKSPAKSKVAILLTDGVSNTGQIQPLQAADLAAKLGIKVYTIGAGRDGVAPVRVPARGGGTVLVNQRFELDEQTLEAIAERTGGRYFHASDAGALIEAVREIDALERTEISEVRYLQYEHHFGAFVALAAALVTLSALASGTVLRRLP